MTNVVLRDTTIVLVEDDQELARMMRSYLTDEGYVVDWFSRGAPAVAHILERQPDLVILDVMLPGIDGVEVCRRIRAQYTNPVLMVTAKDDDPTEISALDTGADGYLSKPVRPHILLAHIRALLRRRSLATPAEDEHTTVIQDLRIDTRTRTVSRADEDIVLPTGLYELLAALVARAGTVVSRDSLYCELRGIEYDGIARSIDLRLSALRKKLGDDIPPYRYIKTVRGQGYILIR